MIAGYQKTLEVESVEKLRGLMNGILNGAGIPNEWKEGKVKLLHNSGRRGELYNFQPIAISVVCKLGMMMVEGEFKIIADDSGLLGEVQDGFGRERRPERVNENMLGLIDRIYDGSMVKYESEDIATIFCQTAAGGMCPVTAII